MQEGERDHLRSGNRVAGEAGEVDRHKRRRSAHLPRRNSVQSLSMILAPELPGQFRKQPSTRTQITASTIDSSSHCSSPSANMMMLKKREEEWNRAKEEEEEQEELRRQLQQSTFFIPGITGKARCLSSKNNKLSSSSSCSTSPTRKSVTVPLKKSTKTTKSTSSSTTTTQSIRDAIMKSPTRQRRRQQQQQEQQQGEEDSRPKRLILSEIDLQDSDNDPLERRSRGGTTPDHLSYQSLSTTSTASSTQKDAASQLFEAVVSSIQTRREEMVRQYGLKEDEFQRMLQELNRNQITTIEQEQPSLRDQVDSIRDLLTDYYEHKRINKLRRKRKKKKEQQLLQQQQQQERYQGLSE